MNWPIFHENRVNVNQSPVISTKDKIELCVEPLRFVFEMISLKYNNATRSEIRKENADDEYLPGFPVMIHQATFCNYFNVVPPEDKFQKKPQHWNNSWPSAIVWTIFVKLSN